MMDNWLVCQTIEQHNLRILIAHPPYQCYKDLILEFISNFEPSNQRIWIEDKYYIVTPTIIAEALQRGSIL